MMHRLGAGDTALNDTHVVPFGCYSIAKLCPTRDPLDCSPPGNSVHGIFQVRIRSGLPCPSPGDLPNPEIEPASCALQADSLPSELGKSQMGFLQLGN